MKLMKRVALILVAVLLLLAFVSCEEPCTDHVDKDGDGKCDACGATVTPDVPPLCTEHTDADGDGLCDVCGATVEAEAGDLVLIEDGEALFQIVVPDGLTSSLRRQIDTLVSDLKKLGVTVATVDDAKDGKEIECEVLIGQIASRGAKYEYDMYSLGKKGYAITAIDKKVIVAAGSTDKLSDAIEKFANDYLGLDEADKNSILNVSVASDVWRVKPQTDYKLDSVSINGTDLGGYTIARPDRLTLYSDAARSLQDALYSRAGYWLPIVSLDAASERSIVIRQATKSECEKGFKISVEGTQLVILCAYDNCFEECMDDFIKSILYATGDLEYGKNYSKVKDISSVYYKDYGAVGDGVTNDYAAIKAAHEFANQGGQTVYGEAGARYLIASTADEDGVCSPIVIMTDTDWRGATIIIDDRNITYEEGANKNYITNVFSIESNVTGKGFEQSVIDAINANGGLAKGTTKIGEGLGFKAMLVAVDIDHMMFIRYGGNASDGAYQRELIVIDEEGNVDPSTPIQYDFAKISYFEVFNLEVEAITVQNANVISRATTIDLTKTNTALGLAANTEHYFARGLEVKRPNVTVKNLVHSIEGEKAKTEFTGPAYGGFIQVSRTSDVVIENCTFQARVHYLQGTYDLGLNLANNVTVKNCTQSNFWVDDAKSEVNMTLCWGLMGSNYSKNLTYDNSQLTRFDAHCGVYNASIINGSEVASIRLTGGGDFLVEDSTIYTISNRAPIISLRDDYGSTFEGTVTIRNCTVVPKNGYGVPTGIFDALTANHDFGYTTYFPNLVFDNVEVVGLGAGDTLELVVLPYSGPTSETNHYRTVFEDSTCTEGAICSDGKVNENVYVPPTSVKVSNNDYTVVVRDVLFFKGTTIEGAEILPYTGPVS